MALDKDKLNLEDLDNISGGYIFQTGYGWEVINDETGDVIADGFSREEAEAFCRSKGIKCREIDEFELEDLRRLELYRKNHWVVDWDY